MSEAGAVVERIAGEGVKVVDFRFTDLAGRWRHVARDAAGVDAAALAEGLLADGSAVPGWREVTDADILLKPDLGSAWLDPFSAQPTLLLVCDATDPASGIGYERCPRTAAQRAEARLADAKVADEVRVAVEVGFFLFDQLRVEAGPWATGYTLAPTGERARAAGNAYLAGPPADPFADVRAEIASILGTYGVEGIVQGHGRAAGQNEIGLAPAGLTRAADQIQALKYVARMVAASYGKTASFLARPLAEAPGSAMRIGQSLWRGGRPLFFGQGYADLAPQALQLRGRHPPPRPGAQRLHQPDHQQLPPPALRRGRAGPARLRGAQPLGGAPHPLRLAPRDQAGRGRLPGPRRQPLPRLRRHPDGRPRRDRAQAGAGRSRRPQPLRPAARGGVASSARSAARSTRRSTRSRPTTTS